ncbi:MAG: hypothetical protein U1E60_24465 [Reyranellaceae bacterium]
MIDEAACRPAMRSNIESRPQDFPCGIDCQNQPAVVAPLLATGGGMAPLIRKVPWGQTCCASRPRDLAAAEIAENRADARRPNEIEMKQIRQVAVRSGPSNQ